MQRTNFTKSRHRNIRGTNGARAEFNDPILTIDVEPWVEQHYPYEERNVRDNNRRRPENSQNNFLQGNFTNAEGNRNVRGNFDPRNAWYNGGNVQETYDHGNHRPAIRGGNGHIQNYDSWGINHNNGSHIREETRNSQENFAQRNDGHINRGGNGNRPYIRKARGNNRNNKGNQNNRPQNYENHSNGMDRNYNNHGNENSNRRRNNVREPRPTGFKQVESLLEMDDVENIIFELSNDRTGFKLLLETNMSDDLVVLVVNLLSKVCESNFSSSSTNILQVALNSLLTKNIIQFISNIKLQSQKDKTKAKYFWNNTDQFWNNLLSICQKVIDVMPTVACEVILKVLKSMQMELPLIEKEHSLHISDDIKLKTNNLLELINKIAIETERKAEIRKVRNFNVDDDGEEPPNNFRDMSVYPTSEEVTSPQKPFLRTNIVEGAYIDEEHYLDVQFRLLREDFVAPLRKGICSYIEKSERKFENVRIYKPVQFLNLEIYNEQNCYRIQYDFSKKQKSFKYENSKRFMFGSLMCFTNDNFATLVFGKIVQRDVKLLEKGQLFVGFTENVDVALKTDYIMVECSIYFEPYYHVLNVLKNMQPEDFPMANYIIGVDPNTEPPLYLQEPHTMYQCDGNSFYPLFWPKGRTFYGLNDAQNKAFQAAITQEFAIIQGPPGTGKTFLGLKIAHTLIKNQHAWYRKSPILVICYTNHALDQFLEGILECTTKILRVGSQSKTEALHQFNLKTVSRNAKSHGATYQKRHEVKVCTSDIETINEILEAVSNNDLVLQFSFFAEVLPDYYETWFGTANNEKVKEWLLEGMEPFYYDRTQLNLDAADSESDDENIDVNDFNYIEKEKQHISITNLISLINLQSMSKRIKFLNKTIYNFTEYGMGSIAEEIEYSKVCQELEELQKTYAYVKKCLSERVKAVGRGVINLLNPQVMNYQARWELYFTCVDLYVAKLQAEKEQLSQQFQNLYKIYQEMTEMENTQLMKEVLVVGMTTTGAARLQSSLQALKSPIVIVEEAAEVLEAHIVASLTSHCQHLILIGDHKQLKPSTADYKIETKYKLGTSLFERMVQNGVQCHTLNVQHRMIPEIASLIAPTIYPDLENHISVTDRPKILGIDTPIFFIDHQEQEQACSDSSKKNMHEVHFLIKFAKYLILNGYKPENITILAAYLGQMFELIKEKKRYPLHLQDVRISVLDNYQGEESDIILLSLVRSNREGKIGFLKIENRVCVALSRARNGFYLMGNMNQLCQNSEIWPKIQRTLEEQGAIGPKLSLRCQIHPDKVTSVSCGEDFLNVPEGGCNQLCDKQLNCGHKCKSICHIENRDHKTYRCRERCSLNLCDNVNHICLKMCYQECGPCIYPKVCQLTCGHSVQLKCHIDPQEHNCVVLVETKLLCGHVANKPCHINVDAFSCPHPCDTRVEPCGHACSQKCHVRKDPDHFEYKCKKPCGEYRTGCTVKDQTHKCRKLCHEECEPCDIKIKKYRTVCPHVFTVACNENVDDLQCEKPCKKKFQCGHDCKSKCFEPCGACDVLVEKLVPGCNHTVKIMCKLEPDRKYCQGQCPRLLPCGHLCTKKCYEICTTKCAALVDCQIPSSCGHTFRKIECHFKYTVFNDPSLLRLCTEPCLTQLKCDHQCSGTCGKCYQGRLHKRCGENCGKILICNHECSIPCRNFCKPCTKPCTYKCKHSTCKRKCGEPCTRCKEPCPRNCRHSKCEKFCGEICSVKPCEEPCQKWLKCNHKCVGFCGDPCPKLCRICDKDELEEIFFGTEDEEEARFVMLQDCGHVLESSGMEGWLEKSDNEIQVKSCPKCKTPLTNTLRYSDYIKQAMIDVNKVKKKINGDSTYNNLKRTGLIIQIQEIENKSIIKTDDTSKLFTNLKQFLKDSYQGRRQNLSKMDLQSITSKVQLLEYILDICKELKVNSTFTMSAKQLHFVISALISEEVCITEQEIDDIEMEINKLRRFIQFEVIQKSPNYRYSIVSLLSNKKSQESVKTIDLILESPKRYNEEIDNLLQKELKELSVLVSSTFQITETERRDIVKAMGLTSGHWFKCPNGHIYVITECGGAMQRANCNECGAQIGGENHRLLQNNALASEMDGARHAAWSETANLENYDGI